MVRDPKRITEIMSLLGEYWTLNPTTMDLRLGQIIHNAKGASELSVFYLEDERLIERLKKMIEYAKRIQDEYGDDRDIEYTDEERGVGE